MALNIFASSNKNVTKVQAYDTMYLLLRLQKEISEDVPAAC